MKRERRRLLVCLLIHACALLHVACVAGAEHEFTLRRLAIDAAGGGDAAISPDGRRFAISSKRSGNWDVWVYDIAGERWSQLTTDPADDFEAQWSPDGRSLAFTSTRSGNKDVWVLSLATGALRRLTTSPDEDEYPAWSPDGVTVVYTGGPWKQRAFFLVSAAGGAPRRLSARSHQAGACSYRWDGTALICHGYDGGSGDVFLIPLNGGATVPLTSGPAWDYKPTIAPGREWFAFSRSEEGSSAIWLQPLGGGVPRALTEDDADDRWPTWNARGDRMLFHRLVERGTAVRMSDRTTGAVRTLVGADERPLQAAFDPTATRIVYTAVDRSGRRVLRVRTLRDDSVITLDTGTGHAAFPRWSPDGTRIAFARKNGPRWEISTVELETGLLQTLTSAWPELHGMDGPIDWSPDGTRLLFHADTQPFEADLYVLHLQRRELHKLTDDEWFDEAPAWTADGSGVLFMSTRGGDWTWGLFRLALDGRLDVMATPDHQEKNYIRPGRQRGVVWTAVDAQGVDRVVERDADGTVRVASTGGEGGRWPSYSSDGRWLLFTSVSRHVEYWMADNVFSRGSPVRAAEHTAVHDAAVSTAIRTGPHDLHHR